jgi:flagellin-like protein
MKTLYGKKEKGVSPVIATILMVAITVVLASAVYLMVSGYIGSAPSKPVALGVVPSTTSTGTQFLISSGSVTPTTTTPLIISVTIPGVTGTYTFQAKTSSSGSLTPGSSNPASPSVTANLYNPVSNPTSIGAGSTITISDGSAPLPSGSTVTFTYNGNVVYSYTVP